MRTIPEIHTEEEDRKLHKTHAFHENGRVFNMCPDYGMLMADGFTQKAEKIRAQLEAAQTPEQKEFLQAMLDVLELVTAFAARYREEAVRVGNQTVADMLAWIPANAPRTLLEALQFLRLLHYAMWCNGNYHNTLGRIDQFLYPYYRHDVDAGLLTKDEAREQLEEFFISCNRDSDLYIGIQQGDNGQSLMLGGCKPEDGASAINDLTYQIMEVTKELKLLDPKINLRIASHTPDDLLELGCELTKCGLGFPQYSNDEVVIPALVKKGYALKDARNYTVAACWEFIIPGKGIEIVNQGAVSMPYAVDDAFEKAMAARGSFRPKKFLTLIRKSMEKQIKNILRKRDIRTLPSPFASIFFHGSIESRRDASECVPYRNVGIHGAGSANAADALAAIRLTFEEEGTNGLKKLLEAKRRNFEGSEEMRHKLQANMT